MEDKKKILEMIANKTITVEEGAKLLNALNSKEIKNKKRAKKLHLEINQGEREKSLLKLSIPISITKLGLLFLPNNAKLKANIPNSNFDFSQIDWKQILAIAQNGEIGEIFYMEVDEENGETTRIRIYID